MTLDSQTAIEFARDAVLPDFDDDILGVEGDDGLTPPDFEKPELAITVGSQIASFSEGIEAELREKIANAFLFAQQASDKQIERAGASSQDWYDTYVDVLSKIGWIREDATIAIRRIKGTSAQVHNEIIPILTAALGPVAASATVINVLKGLNNMNKDSPWITLFNKTSQRAHANQFQISHVDQKEGTPRIKLVNFDLDAQRSVAQVLFFRLDTNEAELRHFETHMSVNGQIFSEVAPIIAERLSDRLSGLISAIEI